MSKTTQTPSATETPKAVPALSFSMDGQQLRVLMRDEDPWFVAKDVCDTLGYANPSKAVADHLDDDERSTITNSESRNGGGKLTIISESGLYALILRSRKPEAKRFRRWVTHEVLPSIRRTGSYSVKHQSQRERQIGRCQALIRDIERSNSKFCRDGLISLASVAFSDVGLPLPDLKGLRPLQMPIPV